MKTIKCFHCESRFCSEQCPQIIQRPVTIANKTYVAILDNSFTGAGYILFSLPMYLGISQSGKSQVGESQCGVCPREIRVQWLLRTYIFYIYPIYFAMIYLNTLLSNGYLLYILKIALVMIKIW